MLVTENSTNAIHPNTTVEELPDCFVYKQYGKPLSIWRKCNMREDCIELNDNKGEITQLFIVINTVDNSVAIEEMALNHIVQVEFNFITGSLHCLKGFEIKKVNLEYWNKRA